MKWDYSIHYARFHPDSAEHDAYLHGLFQRWLGPHLPGEKNVAVLDVGCGRGYAVEWLRRLGYDGAAGIDTDAAQAKFGQGRGFNVAHVEDSVAFLRARPATYGLILLMDVLEHIPRGAECDLLEAIYGALRPGGKLLCVVPNASSPLASYWRYVDYTHQTLFTEPSLEFVFRHAGFREVVVQPLEFTARPRLLVWPPGRATLRWWLRQLGRGAARLRCLGELDWADAWKLPLSPNLLVIAQRDEPCA